MTGLAKKTENSTDFSLTADRAAFWARMPGWRRAEAAALLNGLDPEKIEQLADNAPAAGLKAFYDLDRLFSRSKTMKIIQSPSTPLFWLEWARSNDIPYSHLIEQAVASGKPVRNYEALYISEKEKNLRSGLDAAINPKSARTLYTIIAAMARSKDRRWPDYNLTKWLADEIDLQGLECTEETVRKVLRTAITYLPDGDQDPDS